MRVERAVLGMGRHVHRPRLAAAVVDRLTFNAHIIQTGSSSYRLSATTRARKEPAAT
jgi:hypothetical protein